MAGKAHAKRERLAAWIGERRLERIRETDWQELLQGLAPVSERTLRTMLRETGLPLDPLVEGVRQADFDELQRTLVALSAEYQEAMRSGDRRRSKACRRLVIAAKDHARWASARAKAPEKSREKTEMAAWMLTWLENPPLFPDWAALRRQATPAVLSAPPPTGSRGTVP